MIHQYCVYSLFRCALGRKIAINTALKDIVFIKPSPKHYIKEQRRYLNTHARTFPTLRCCVELKTSLKKTVLDSVCPLIADFTQLCNLLNIAK